MGPTVRVVCGSCLRSVERSATPEGSLPSQCPYCGGAVESHSSQIEPSAAEASLPAGSAQPSTPNVGMTTDWVKTWTRGSLGTLGRFQLRERLGDGGFGQVYRAYDPRLDRDVAIKVLKQPNPTERVMERFFREARAVARLDHPNIVLVHDAGYDAGRCWVAYQLVSGRPLWWYRDHHRMDPPTVARIVRSLADALHHSHHLGVVHRDIKPANILIDDQGQPRLIDFGLARRSDFESDLTREGAVVGTPAYMSPEQALGRSRQADERSDVYSLGVIFYELLHGRRPDESNTDSGPAPKPAPSPSTATVDLTGQMHLPAVPAALHRICQKAMSTNPAQRYPTARELADDLDAWMKNLERRRGRGRLSALHLALAAAGLLVLAVLYPAFLAWSHRPGRPGGDRELTGPGPLGLAAVPATTAPAADHARLVGNRNTHTYHLATCRYASTINADNLVPLKDAADAALRNYKACDSCQPAGAEPPSDQTPNEDTKGS